MNTDDSDFMVQRQGVSVSWYGMTGGVKYC